MTSMTEYPPSSRRGHPAETEIEAHRDPRGGFTLCAKRRKYGRVWLSIRSPLDQHAAPARLSQRVVLCDLWIFFREPQLCSSDEHLALASKFTETSEMRRYNVELG